MIKDLYIISLILQSCSRRKVVGLKILFFQLFFIFPHFIYGVDKITSDSVQASGDFIIQGGVQVVGLQYISGKVTEKKFNSSSQSKDFSQKKFQKKKKYIVFKNNSTKTNISTPKYKNLRKVLFSPMQSSDEFCIAHLGKGKAFLHSENNFNYHKKEATIYHLPSTFIFFIQKSKIIFFKKYISNTESIFLSQAIVRPPPFVG